MNCVYGYKTENEGHYRCKLNKTATVGNIDLAVCMFDRDSIGNDRARKVLHDYQKYRRGNGSINSCPPPYVIGISIDRAIRCLRNLTY